MRSSTARATVLFCCLIIAAVWVRASGEPDTRPARELAAPTPGSVPPEPPGTPAPVPKPGPPCLSERDLPINPAAAPLQVGLKTYPRTLALRDREVVLTFDDGPARDTTPKILDALKAACVHATFFLIGRHAAELPHLAQREMAEGHSVGHHSQTHPAFTLRGFDTASAERDIEAGIASDERAAYGAAASPEHPHAPFFRFPGFADTPALLAFLEAKKIAVFGADLWAADWLEMTPEHELERMLALLEKAPHHNGILLFHDTRPSTARMLPELLAELRARGYSVGRLVYDPKAPAPTLTAPVAGWSSATERIIAHLRRPIVPGAHHAAAGAEPILPEGMGETPADPPRERAGRLGSDR